MPHPSFDDSPDSSPEVRVSVESLKKLLVGILTKKSVFPYDAETAALRMIEADLRGWHAEGSRMIGRCLNALDAGDIDPRAQVLTLHETAAIAVLDGSRALGQVAATKAMQLAMHKARAVGTGTVAVKNSQHLGAPAVYVLLAAQEGMIGYCTTSTGGASVAASGSTQAATADNAFAWGAPTREGPPLVHDSGCAAVSWENVESLKLCGGELPPNAALDAGGAPTTDPAAAKTLLPAVGSGFGMACLCSVLAGPLSGGKMPIHKTRTASADGSQHFFYAIDVPQFCDPDRFYRELQATIHDIRALTPAAGCDRVRLPGELEWERAERFRRDGIPLPPDHAAELAARATALKVDVPW